MTDHLDAIRAKRSEELAGVMYDARGDERGNEVPFLGSEARTKLARAARAALLEGVSTC